MAILAIDETMLREPRLLVPGRQPLGQVRIDWSNSLSRDLSFAWVPNRPESLVSRELLNVSNAKTKGNLIGPGGYTATQLGSTGGIVKTGSNPASFNNQTFTVLGYAMVDTGSGNAGSVVHRDMGSATSSWGIYIWHGSAKGVGYQINGTLLDRIVTESNLYSQSVTVGVPYVLALTFTGGTAEFWVNGYMVQTHSGYGDIDYSRTDTSGYLGCENFLGWVWFAAIWKRVLSPSEIVSVSKDPFQFLLPA